jgi:hypothetical protein
MAMIRPTNMFLASSKVETLYQTRIGQSNDKSPANRTGPLPERNTERDIQRLYTGEIENQVDEVGEKTIKARGQAGLLIGREA